MGLVHTGGGEFVFLGVAVERAQGTTPHCMCNRINRVATENGTIRKAPRAGTKEGNARTDEKMSIAVFDIRPLDEACRARKDLPDETPKH